MTGIPGMAVPVFTVVNVGLAMTFLGGGLLLLIALWWTRDGRRDRDPATAVARGRALRRAWRGGSSGWAG